MLNYAPEPDSSFPMANLKRLYAEKKKYTTVIASTSTHDDTVTTDHYLCAEVESVDGNTMHILTFHVNALSKYRDGRTMKERKNVRSTSLSNISSVLCINEIRQSMGSARFIVYGGEFFSEEIKTEESNTVAFVIAGGMAPIVNNIPQTPKHGIFVLRLVFHERVGWALHTHDNMAFYPSQIQEFTRNEYSNEVTDIYNSLIRGTETYEAVLARVVRFHAIYLYLNRDKKDFGILYGDLRGRLCIRNFGHQLYISKHSDLVLWVHVKPSGELNVYLRAYSNIKPDDFIYNRVSYLKEKNEYDRLSDEAKRNLRNISNFPFYVYDAYRQANYIREYLINVEDKYKVLTIGRDKYKKVMIVPEIDGQNKHSRVGFEARFLKMYWSDVTNFTKETTQDLFSLGIFIFFIPFFSFSWQNQSVSIFVEERTDIGTVINAVVIFSLPNSTGGSKRSVFRWQFRIEMLLRMTQDSVYSQSNRLFSILPYFELPSNFFHFINDYSEEEQAKVRRLFEDNAPFSITSVSVTRQLDRIDNTLVEANVLQYIYHYINASSIVPSGDIRAQKETAYFLPTDHVELKSVTSQQKYEHTDSAIVYSDMQPRAYYGDVRDTQTFRNEVECSVLPINALYPQTILFVGKESHQAPQNTITYYFSGYVSFVFYATEIGPTSKKYQWFMNLSSYTHKYVRGGHYQFFVPNDEEAYISHF